MSIKINVKDLDKCQKRLQIEIPKDAIQTEFDRYYEELKKTAQVPGFRKGKVPRNVLEEYFSGKAQEKVL
ncbi:MAG: trigger factor family protein, partial [Candidatus Omnitrophica bacterium]|nr:trigger factor family protein [Candidatus Omnitrophota bacterium]